MAGSLLPVSKNAGAWHARRTPAGAARHRPGSRSSAGPSRPIPGGSPAASTLERSLSLALVHQQRWAARHRKLLARSFAPAAWAWGGEAKQKRGTFAGSSTVGGWLISRHQLTRIATSWSGFVDIDLAQQTFQQFRLSQIGGKFGSPQQPVAFGPCRAAQSRRISRTSIAMANRAAAHGPRRHAVVFAREFVVRPDGRRRAMP